MPDNPPTPRAIDDAPGSLLCDCPLDLPSQRALAVADSSLGSQRLGVAIYIESIAAELRTMARIAELESLAYFLEMVRLEASILVTEQATAQDEQARPTG